MNLKAKFRGAMFGTAVGDAVGRHFEGRGATSREEVESAAKGELKFTDDTQMAMDLAESLVELRGFDAEHAAKLFAKNYDPSRGYGISTTFVLQKIKEGAAWDAPAKEAIGGKGSYGNGAAMRIAPVAISCHHDAELLRSVAEESSKITHVHELGIEGAVLQAFAVAFATGSDPSEGFTAQEFIQTLMAVAKNEVYLEKLKAIQLLLDGGKPSEVVERLGNGGEAFNSVLTAIYSFLSSPKDFREAVVNAVSLGGDADTIGAMTGAISGAFLGESAIPEEWRMKVEGREKLQRLADGLFFTFIAVVLGKRCEACLTEERVKAYKVDPEGEDDVSNFILLCPACRRETEEEKEAMLAKPKKAGKYRSVYRKVYKKVG
ncbi:MAG: ADP-ribosylglycohydrolase family protein [Candidatus Hadarchaeota archaeon]